ncbi:aprataxin [Lingula anatina]|uniref:Aprataxin n=1 Tax=Lingula anatina TaxID=7574 RepID=A0A1S3IFF8_LINAN|nr:aprataxin [Lingula anatina]|eukprot:XP_013396967.1 aprataxin [Lingula anatina]
MSNSGGLKRKADNHDGKHDKKRPVPPWALGLKSSMEDPALRVEDDDKVVIIKDKYPKARQHYLILPKEDICNLKSLNAEHIPLLKHMQKKGQELADKSPQCQFRLGYHGIPSMSQVHLHVISQDFDSPCLKTKKHWNSFTSEYFIDSSDVIKQLEEKGSVKVDTGKFEGYLKQALKCHVCKKDFKTMPALKSHILQHAPKKTS